MNHKSDNSNQPYINYFNSYVLLESFAKLVLKGKKLLL